MKKWIVEGSNGNKYIVSYTDGIWKCSCPKFIFQKKKLTEKEPCKHILYIQSLSEDKRNKLKEVGNVSKLHSLRKNGFIILDWEYNYFYRAEKYKKEMRLKAEHLKQNGKIKRWLGINEGEVYYLLIKPKFIWYSEQVDNFEKELNELFDEIKNTNSIWLKSKTIWDSRTIFTEYNYIKDKYNNLVQLVLYNQSGYFNENITKEEFRILNNRLLEFGKVIQELHKIVENKDKLYTKKSINDILKYIDNEVGYADRLIHFYKGCLKGSCYYNEIILLEQKIKNKENDIYTKQ